MRVLLDTHIVVWAWTAPGRLTQAARTVIQDATNQLLVSAASAWEIATKVRSGKLLPAVALERDFARNVTAAGFLLISIDADIALRAGRLTSPHRDPFDRILAAHALAEDIGIISADRELDSFGVRRIW